jgi:hypothetical protein
MSLWSGVTRRWSTHLRRECDDEHQHRVGRMIGAAAAAGALLFPGVAFAGRDSTPPRNDREPTSTTIGAGGRGPNEDPNCEGVARLSPYETRIDVGRSQASKYSPETKKAYAMVCALVDQKSKVPPEQRFAALQQIMTAAGVPENASVDRPALEAIARYFDGVGMRLSRPGIAQFRAHHGLPRADASFDAELALAYARATQGQEVLVEMPAKPTAAQRAAAEVFRGLGPKDAASLLAHFGIALELTPQETTMTEKLGDAFVSAESVDRLVASAHERGVAIEQETAIDAARAQQLAAGALVVRAPAEPAPQQRGAIELFRRVAEAEGVAGVANFKAELGLGPPAAHPALEGGAILGNEIVDEAALQRLIEAANARGISLEGAIDGPTAAAIRDQIRIALDASTVRGAAFLLLAHPNVTYWTGLSSGADRRAIEEIARTGSAYVPVTGGRVTPLLNMMQALVDMANHGPIQINALTGGVHSSNSRHYSGTAVDLDVAVGSPGQIEAIANAHGGSRNFERDHIHLDFYA